MGSRHFLIECNAPGTFEKACNEAHARQMIDEGRHIEEQENEKKRTKAVRQALRDHFGKRNYKITRNGDIHVYGLMPNSIVIGWWGLGNFKDAEIWLSLRSGGNGSDNQYS